MSTPRTILSFALLAVSMVAVSCTPVADPRQGGLFGYSPEDYERRIREREAKLQQVEETSTANYTEKDRLEAEITSTQAERDRLQGEIAAFDRDLNTLRNSLSAQEHKTAASRQQQQQIEEQLNSLRRNSWRTGKQLESGDVAGKEQEIAALRQKLAGLMEEAELLGRLE